MTHIPPFMITSMRVGAEGIWIWKLETWYCKNLINRAEQTQLWKRQLLPSKGSDPYCHVQSNCRTAPRKMTTNR